MSIRDGRSFKGVSMLLMTHKSINLPKANLRVTCATMLVCSFETNPQILQPRLSEHISYFIQCGFHFLNEMMNTFQTGCVEVLRRTNI